jgi:hypothetical protein
LRATFSGGFCRISTAKSTEEIPHEQERVWERDWLSFFPPTIEELEAAAN